MPKIGKPRGKIARRLGVNVFGNPKYDKLLRKKPDAPGSIPGTRKRKRISDYGLQLLEKQKLRYHYGLSEKQFKNTFFKAKKKSGITGDILIRMLESRLDNTIYRLGWAASREQARQMVGHKHFRLNGKSVNIPSILLQPGDRIEVKSAERSRTMVRNNIAAVNREKCSWLETDADSLSGEFKIQPAADEAAVPADIQAVIEFYSRQGG